MSAELRGRHRFAKQIGGWGSFAEVEVVITNDDSVRYVFDDLDTDDPRREDWVAGVQFGFRYGLAQVPKPNGYNSIRVTKLLTNPVDSSTMSVAFATCFAVWDALGWLPDVMPCFDEVTKSFVFPR